MGTTDTPEQRAATLAAEQHGVITLAQALALGMTEGQVRHRVSAGRWIRRCARGLCRGRHTLDLGTGHHRGLSGAPRGAVGIPTSAPRALYRLLDPPETPEITVPKGRQQPIPRGRGSPVDGRRRRRDGNRPDLGHNRGEDGGGLRGTPPLEDLCEFLDDALCERLCTTWEIAEAMERSTQAPGRPGLASLERALVPWTPGLMPGSRAEMRLIRRLLAWGFPAPERQVKLFDAHGRFVARLDVAWRERTTGLEYYGERHHGPRHAAHDERRLSGVTALGWSARVVRKADLSGRRAEALRRWLSERLS